METNQIEMKLEGSMRHRRRRRPRAARWWFGYMRMVVNQTMEWQPMAPVPPTDPRPVLPATAAF